MSKRIFTFILALALLLSVANSFSFESSAASTVKIGHASTSNNNTVAGDASGKEVCTRNWYCESSTPWQYVFRPKSSSVAEKIAKAMEQACSNNNIGYNQNKRTTLFTQAKAKNWNLSSITTKCDTDCSALIAVCVNAAGISVSKDMYTGNQYSILKNTGKFDIYTSSDYTKKSDNLKRGDILLKRYNGAGHTVVVLSNSSKVEEHYNYFPKCSSSYTSIVDALKSIGVDSSYAYRKKIAAANNIANYSGTATQNSNMLKLLKAGTLIRPEAATTTKYFPKCSSSYTSIVDALKSIGVDSSYAYRKKIAAANNIANYSGTATQNSNMLKLLKAGTLIKP